MRSDEKRAGGRDVKLSVLLAITFFAGTTFLAQDFPRGRVVPRVACTAVPAYSYALYLPSNYTPERRGSGPSCSASTPQGADGPRPSVGEGRRSLRLHSHRILGLSERAPRSYLEGAERALERGAVALCSLEEGRCYAAGFSGGARAAVRMALDHRGAFAGVLCCGAFLPGDRSPALRPCPSWSMPPRARKTSAFSSSIRRIGT